MNAARAVVSVLLLAAGAMLFAGPLAAVDCLRPVGELPEGPSLAVDMEGRLAAFGRGRVLVLVDLTDPSDPVELGSVVLPGVVQSVELTATHAWVAAGPVGLIGVDVTDPGSRESSATFPAGLADEPASAVDPAPAAGIAYVAETFEMWTEPTRAAAHRRRLGTCVTGECRRLGFPGVRSRGFGGRRGRPGRDDRGVVGIRPGPNIADRRLGVIRPCQGGPNRESRLRPRDVWRNRVPRRGWRFCRVQHLGPGASDPRCRPQHGSIS
jgi:hypothetical protein